MRTRIDINYPFQGNAELGSEENISEEGEILSQRTNKHNVTSRLEGKHVRPLALPATIPKNIAPKETSNKDETVKNTRTRFKI